MELSTEEFSINSVFRTGVDVHLHSFVGSGHTRDLEHILGAVSGKGCLDHMIVDGECEVINGAISVLFFCYGAIDEQ